MSLLVVTMIVVVGVGSGMAALVARIYRFEGSDGIRRRLPLLIGMFVTMLVLAVAIVLSRGEFVPVAAIVSTGVCAALLIRDAHQTTMSRQVRWLVMALALVFLALGVVALLIPRSIT